MTYCVNPWCKSRENNVDAEFCTACQQPLLVNERFRCIKPILLASRQRRTEILEAVDTIGSFVNPPGTKVVLKTLVDEGSKIEELFNREAESLCYFNHPGIPKSDINDLFRFRVRNGDEFICFAMTKIEGVNLEEWIKVNGAISQKNALDWLKQITEILQELHSKGFMHRDIKPSNIMVQPDRRLALIDFGAVRRFGDTYLAKLSMNGYGLTQVHTIGFSPPEQMNGRTLPQSDFYALGRTLIYCVTGLHFLEIPINHKTGELLWQKEAKQIDLSLIKFIESLVLPIPRERPKNTQEILNTTAEIADLKSKTRKSGVKFPKKINKLYYIASISLFIITLIGSLLNSDKIYSNNSKYYFAEQLLSAASAQPGSEKWNNLKRNLESFISERPSAQAYNQFGILCRRMKDIDCSEKEFKQAITLQPEYLEPYMRLGNLYEDIGRFNDAKKAYQNAIVTSHGQAILPYINLSRINLLFSNPNDAEANIKQAYQFKQIPKKILRTLNKNLAWLKLDRKQYEEATTYAEKAIELDTQYASAYCIAALAEYELGKISYEHREDCMFMASDDSNYPEVKAWRRKLFNIKN